MMIGRLEAALGLHRKIEIPVPITFGHDRVFFFSSRRRHTSCGRDWSSDVCSSDLHPSTNPTPHAHTATNAVPSASTLPASPPSAPRRRGAPNAASTCGAPLGTRPPSASSPTTSEPPPTGPSNARLDEMSEERAQCAWITLPRVVTVDHAAATLALPATPRTLPRMRTPIQTIPMLHLPGQAPPPHLHPRGTQTQSRHRRRLASALRRVVPRLGRTTTPNVTPKPTHRRPCHPRSGE